MTFDCTDDSKVNSRPVRQPKTHERKEEEEEEEEEEEDRLPSPPHTGGGGGGGGGGGQQQIREGERETLLAAGAKTERKRGLQNANLDSAPKEEPLKSTSKMTGGHPVLFYSGQSYNEGKNCCLPFTGISFVHFKSPKWAALVGEAEQDKQKLGSGAPKT